MPSLKLSNPFRRGAPRPSLKERAAALKASARRVMRKPIPDPIFALIEAAIEAERLTNEPHGGDAAPSGSPLAREAEAETSRRTDAEDSARLTALLTRPGTIAGLHALVAFGCEGHARWTAGMIEDMPGTAELLATIRDSVGLLSGGEAPAAVEAIPAGGWHNPPLGFMASPAIKPLGFTLIENGIRIEADRLLGIAVKEFERRGDALGPNASADERRAWSRKLRSELHLDALASIAHPDMIEAAGGYRYTPQTAEEAAAGLQAAAEPETDIPAATSADHIYAAITASRKAEAALEAWEVEERRPTWLAEESALVAEQTRARDAAFATVPTTRGGQLALLDFVRWQLELHGYRDGSPPDGDCAICQETHQALVATLKAGVSGENEDRSLSQRAFDYAHGLDLSTCSIVELDRLHDTFLTASDILLPIVDEPLFWSEAKGDYTPGGKVVDAEHNRLACLRDACAAEMARRRPADEDERHRRLGTMLRDDLRSYERVQTAGLLAEINAAWGA